MSAAALWLLGYGAFALWVYWRERPRRPIPSRKE